MNSNIAESHHVFHDGKQRSVQPSASAKQFEDIARALRNAQTFPANEVLPHIQCRLTSTLNIQNGRVLTGEVGSEGFWSLVVLLTRSRYTTFNCRGFVDQYVINHESAHPYEYLPAEPIWRRPVRFFR